MLLTPPGAGAIAVMRVVGSEAIRIANRVFRSKRGRALSVAEPNRLRYGWIVDDETGDRDIQPTNESTGIHSTSGGCETIDDVIACVVVDVEARRTAKEEAESVVELCTHGGVRVVERILQLLERHGAPLALTTKSECNQPSWSQQSLIEREADEQLLAAKSERAVRFLARQRVLLSRAIKSLLNVSNNEPERITVGLQKLMEHYDNARTLIEGATIAIVGPPNSGKSTLFNRLVGRYAAIVSPAPGTTRDWIEATIELNGAPVTLLDTAGVHQTIDQLEQAAIDAGRQAGAMARLFLLVLDGSAPLPEWILQETDWPVWTNALRRSEMLLVVNKSDQRRVWQPAEIEPFMQRMSETGRARFAHASADKLDISAQTGEGIDRLTHRVAEFLGMSGWDDRLPCVFVDRQRQNISGVLSLPITDMAGIHDGLVELIGDFA
jgi:tRNA modification GTPase